MTIKNNVASTLSSLAMLIGCATAPTPYEKLDILPGSFDFVTDNGYAMDVFTQQNLRMVAGIYAGTMKVFTDGPGESRVEGSYSQFMQPKAMQRALKEADIDGDKIITSEEGMTLYQKVIRENTTLY